MHGALGKPRFIGNGAHTDADTAPFVSCGPAIKVQINDKGGWFLVVSDQIAHKDIEHVVIDGNSLSKTGHRESITEELRRTK
jgi:hypothetical protein